MTEFKKAIINGLSSQPKTLPSRYFYDEKGDRLFQEIMHLKEYYLPGKEREILSNLTQHLEGLIDKNHLYEIIELGAGDGSKTVKLLKAFHDAKHSIIYRPLDISPNVLEQNKAIVLQQAPQLPIHAVSGNYFIEYPKLESLAENKLVLFLGSNIGNFTFEKAKEFVSFISENFTKDDKLLISFDMVKDPRKILAAYDDSKGVTAKFNLNLLDRINRELGANFNSAQFSHYPTYNPLTGETKSYIISKVSQEVQLSDGISFQFKANEAIHTEISKKYFEHEIEEIAANADLQIGEYFWDQEKEYTLVLFQK